MEPATSQAADQIDEIIRPLRKSHINNKFSRRGIRVRQLADELTAHSKVRRVGHDVPPVSRAPEHNPITGYSPAGRKVPPTLWQTTYIRRAGVNIPLIHRGRHAGTIKYRRLGTGIHKPIRHRCWQVPEPLPQGGAVRLRQLLVVLIRVNLCGNSELAKIAKAFDAAPPFFGASQCWQEQGGQDSDDRNNDEQFDKGKSRGAPGTANERFCYNAPLTH